MTTSHALHLFASSATALPPVRRAGGCRRRRHPGPKAAMTLRIAEGQAWSRWARVPWRRQRRVPVRRSVAARGGTRRWWSNL